MIPAAHCQGVPVFAICRGIPEPNVALGGGLHQQGRDVPGRADHCSGPGARPEQYCPKNDAALTDWIAAIVGQDRIRVNSWHPEWGFAADPYGMALFRAFGNVCWAYSGQIRRAA